MCCLLRANFGKLYSCAFYLSLLPQNSSFVPFWIQTMMLIQTHTLSMRSISLVCFIYFGFLFECDKKIQLYFATHIFFASFCKYYNVSPILLCLSLSLPFVWALLNKPNTRLNHGPFALCFLSIRLFVSVNDFIFSVLCYCSFFSSSATLVDSL